MKILGDQTYFTIGEVARRIGRLPQTIKNWYKWYENQDEETKEKYPLPKPITDLDAKGTHYFREEDVELLNAFKNSIKYGTMSDFSSTRWGKRGQEIQQRKENS
jgi:transposase-like protein